MTTETIYENEPFELRSQVLPSIQEPLQDVYANQSTVDSVAASAANPSSSVIMNNNNNNSFLNKQKADNEQSPRIQSTPSLSSTSSSPGHVDTNSKGPPPLPPSTVTMADGQVMSVQQQQMPQLLHWSEVIYECTDVPLEEWVIAGGSDYGQMPYLLDNGDILLELDGIQLAGLTRTDILDIVRSSDVHRMKAVSNTSSFGLPVDLREYLSRRFVRGSVDHDLQATIRDNVYMRTIPCTTRPPRPGEMDDVDYRFITRDEFLLMEKSGILLESGIYAGHYYGTPLPLSNPATPTTTLHNNGTSDASLSSRFARMTVNQEDDNEGQSTTLDASFDPNGSPNKLTMAQKRRRNRSNIAAIDASSLPHGWEKISDAHYGVYYIDHINKRTQYERPYEIELTKGSNGFGFTLIELDRGLIVVKNVLTGGPAASSGIIQPGDVLVSVTGVSVTGLLHSDIAKLFSNFTVGDRVKLTFARGYQLPPEVAQPVEEVDYDYFSVELEKGPQGFGFTIADGNAGQRVKKILDEDRCNSLRQGDVLCLVNHVDLTPLSHTQVVEILKECPIGQTATITVKRKKRFRSKTPTVSMFPGSTIESFGMKPRSKTPSAADMMSRTTDTEQWVAVNGSIASQPQYINTIEVRNQNLSAPALSMVNGVPTGHFDENSNPTTSHPPPPPPPPPPANVPPETFPKPVMVPPSRQVQNMSIVEEGEPSLMTSPFFEPIERSEEEYEYHRVELVKGENGFGFRIVGGAEDGRNIAVGSIVIGGIAYQDGILKSGDDIISINDHNVTGAYHHQVVDIMASCGQTASLLIRRRKYADAFEVVLNRQDNEGFGFVLISCGYACLIGRIIDDSPAHKCGRLRLRDQIMKVNDMDITSKSHAEIVQMILESGSSLKLTIIPSDCYSVELMRGPRGFGFSIRGGSEFDGMHLFILKVATDGPAYTLISVGDEIIEINNHSTAGMTHTDAVQMISNSGPLVKLKLRRNNQGNSSIGTLKQVTVPLSQSVTYSNIQSTFRASQQQQQQQTYSNYPYSAPNLNHVVSNNVYTPVYP